MKILVIPDPHAHPDYDNKRFDTLGRFIGIEQPDTIVCLGDMADMPSLSSYDRGRRSAEGRRYKDDVAVTRDALARIDRGIEAVNDMAKSAHRRRYRPRKIMCLGNHEDRIAQATNDSANLHGAIGVEDLGYEEFGWEQIPYKEWVAVDGFYFCHYFPNGKMGKPIGGKHLASTLSAKGHVSCIQGHAHDYGISVDSRLDGSRILSINAGCFTHPEFGVNEGWSKNIVHLWDRGVSILEGTSNGWCEEYRRVSLARMEQIVRKARVRPPSRLSTVPGKRPMALRS